ncbi:ankyrin repeat-containing domain protein [Lophiotrema nucula]|uniref:Ankyrin repeat-containing domain protein n=1 Tax=Lophiotrema nucula TaxID=690887 RepID=A0A6A5Z3W4_9PLEO|nr:ankyrin repeat-containing domain protein [Lophiotrema nucula]
MTEFLLQHGADANIDSSPMETAILSSWPELVQLLVRYGANPYLEGELRLLPRAAASGRLETVIRLVEKGADIHEPSIKPPDIGSPLYLAIGGCNTGVVDYLLRAGADPNSLGLNSKTY